MSNGIDPNEEQFAGLLAAVDTPLPHVHHTPGWLNFLFEHVGDILIEESFEGDIPFRIALEHAFVTIYAATLESKERGWENFHHFDFAETDA